MDSLDLAKFARPIALLNEVKRLLRHCLVCSSPKIAVIGLFVPNRDHQALFFDNLRPGASKERYYALCRRCFTRNRRSRCQLVENKFIAIVAAERAEQGQTLQ